MANLTTGLIPNYTTDLGTAVENLTFKIRADKLGVTGFAQAPQGVCAGTGRIFNPRALIGEYPDKSKIRYPVANFLTLAAQVQTILLDGAVCVHLDGESWAFIPPNFLNNADPTRTAYAPQPAGVTQIETGSYDYTSDVIGEVTAQYKMEMLPAPLFNAAKGCLANPVIGTTPCTLTGQISPRHLTVIANREGGGTFARKTFPETRGDDVLDCGESLLGVGLCVRYKGESVRNVQILTQNQNP